MLRLPTLLVLVSLGMDAVAEDAVQSFPGGEVNWTHGVIYAEGYGTASPDIKLGAQRRLLSRRAAVVDAQRNLLEITKGVRVTSMTRVSDMMVASDTTATRVRGIVKGAVVVRENYQNDIYSITMMMPVGGKLLQAVLDEGEIADGQGDLLDAGASLIATGVDRLLSFLVRPVGASTALDLDDANEADTVRKILDWLRSSPPDDVEKALVDSIERFERGSRYSGLLINAAAVSNFEVAAVPRIRDEDGNVIYPTERTSFQDVVKKRGVTYDLDLEDAIRNERVATSPFVVEAVGTWKNRFSDLVISKADAARIRESAGTVEAMNGAGVLIVIGM